MNWKTPIVVSPKSEGGQIHLNPVAIWLMPALHFDLLRTSSILNPTFTLFCRHASMSFSTSLSSLDRQLHYLMVKIWQFSLVNTLSSQQTLFVISSWSIVLFKPNIIIKSYTLLLSMSFAQFIAFIILRFFRRISIYLIHTPFSLPFIGAGLI